MNNRIRCQVWLADVAPTILDILDAEVRECFEGVSLEPLLRLETDPGEHDNTASAQPGILAYLDGVLFPTLCGLSGTWYFELVGGEGGSRFDLTVKAAPGSSIGRIDTYMLFDRTGRVLDGVGVVTAGAGSVLELGIADLQGSCRLAFDADPAESPIYTCMAG